MSIKDFIQCFLILLVVNILIFTIQGRDGSLVFALMFGAFFVCHAVHIVFSYTKLKSEVVRTNLGIVLLGYPIAGICGYFFTKLVTS